VGFLIVSLLFLSCAGRAPDRDELPQAASAVKTPRPSPTVQPTRAPRKEDRQLEAALAKIAEEAEGTVGIAAEMFETGHYAVVGSSVKYPTQSVYKLPIAMAVLKKIDDGQTTHEQNVVVSPTDFVRWGFHSPIRNLNPGGTVLPVSELLRASISESDGTASDLLLEIAGGPVAVQRYLTELGIKDFIVADSEKEISKDWETQYRNSSTVDAALELLRVIYERRSLSESSNELLLRLMHDTEGSPKRLIRGLPPGAELSHKTGTGGTKNKITGATNDIGIVTLPDGRHIGIVVFITDSAAPAAVRADVTGKIARAVIDRFAPGLYPPEPEPNSHANSNSNSEPAQRPSKR
jgi:beta-lactamase class A